MDTVSNILRRVMAESGISHRRISIDTGINRTCLARFRDGLPLTTDNADKLAAYLNLTLTPVPTSKARGKKESK